MTISPLPIRDVLYNHSLVPQAVIGKPVSYFENNMKLHFVRDHDEFDDYEGAAFRLNGRLVFTIMHYKGHPRDTTTVYLPYAISDINQITETIYTILAALNLERNVLLWQRADNPEL